MIMSKTVLFQPGTYFEPCSRQFFKLNFLNQIHGCQDHAKVNQMAKTKYAGTFSNEQIEPTNFQSFAEIQKAKSTLHIKIQTLGKTKIVLKARHRSEEHTSELSHSGESRMPSSA